MKYQSFLLAFCLILPSTASLGIANESSIKGLTLEKVFTFNRSYEKKQAFCLNGILVATNPKAIEVGDTLRGDTFRFARGYCGSPNSNSALIMFESFSGNDFSWCNENHKDPDIPEQCIGFDGRVIDLFEKGKFPNE